MEVLLCASKILVRVGRGGRRGGRKKEEGEEQLS